MKLSDIYCMFINFETVKDNIKGEISISYDDNEVNLKIGGFFTILCNKDEFSSVCGEIDNLKIGGTAIIGSVPVIITDIDIETIEDFNRAWEEAEMRELMFLDDL